MASSSIFKDVKIKGKQKVESFVACLEKAEGKACHEEVQSIKTTYITKEEDIEKLSE